MRSFLKRALEDFSQPPATDLPIEERTILMRGPLADIYTKALDVVYAKPDPMEEQAGQAMESQQMDAHIMQKLSEALVPAGDAPPTDNFDTVYGVSRNELSEQTVVDVTTELAKKSPGPDSSDFYLIIDAMNLGEDGGAPGEGTVKIAQIGQALECMVTSFGGRVFHSLQEFAASRK